MAVQVFWEILTFQMTESMYNYELLRGQCERFWYVDNFTLTHKAHRLSYEINYLRRSYNYATEVEGTIEHTKLMSILRCFLSVLKPVNLILRE